MADPVLQSSLRQPAGCPINAKQLNLSFFKQGTKGEAGARTPMQEDNWQLEFDVADRVGK